MGIPGLTTYIQNHSDRYLRNYELHDTYLVIDGNNVSCQIYNSYATYSSAFGGDYDSYAHAVSTFFDDLLKCRITPLVLIDGGDEEKKLSTSIKRKKQKVQAASSFSLLDQHRTGVFPSLQIEIFIAVMRKKNIRHAQCLFEADNEIAAIAKILNCPVLSYDSDFYIYGSRYIPFNTLDKRVECNNNSRRYVKRCKIYEVRYLLESFRGLHESVLPLAAVLLGNDYVESGRFKDFVRHLDWKGVSGSGYKENRIEATFTWLSNYTLDEAIIRILESEPASSRQSLLNLIEDNINSYMKTSAEMLVPLRFPAVCVARAKTNYLNRSFKFNGDINISTKGACEGQEDETSKEEDDDIIERMSTIDVAESSQNEAISNLPDWFVNEYLTAKLPRYFVNLIAHRLYICPTQIENYDYPSSNVISLKIISVIFGLLKSATNDEVRCMKYVIRDQNRIVERELRGTEVLNFCKLPCLSNLREIPLTLRREILNETLGINDADCIHELPPEWILYFGCIKYWIKEQEPYVFHKSNVYAILIGMIFHVIDTKIGLYRTIRNFEKYKGQKVEAIKHKRRANDYKPCCTTNGTVIEAYNEVNNEDCHLAASFFISHFGIDIKLVSGQKMFDRSVVHAFAQFQNCLKHAMGLNALLECPYPRTLIATFFNGTLLYNLSNNFRTHQDIEKYVDDALGMSPSLLRLFHALLSKIQSAFTPLFQDEVNHSTKQKESEGSKIKNDESDTNADDD